MEARQKSEPADQVNQLAQSEQLKPGGLILALDTASDHIAIAIGRVGSIGDAASTSGSASDNRQTITLIAADDHPAMRQANVQLMPSIEALFQEHQLDRRQIAAVVCGLGPGSFTGVRIGVATAKGLATGLGVPLYGVSTLDVIAWNAWQNGIRGRLGIVADAMRGEVYPARFMLDKSGATRLDPHTVAKADDVARYWVGKTNPILLAGDGLNKHWKAFVDNAPCCVPFFGSVDEKNWIPTGQGLLLAFTAARDAGELGSGEPGALLPIYTRLSDAEENERKRLASSGKVVQGALVDVPRSGVADPTQLEAISYRPLAIGDLEQVATMEAEVFSSADAWSQALFADELPRTDRTWWVACLGDELIGYAGGWLVDGDLQVLRVAVAPAFRQQGVANLLVRHLARDGNDLAATSISLEVRASNLAAQALYASLGFASEGVRPEYYPADQVGQPREEAVILRAKLPLVIKAGELAYVAGGDFEREGCAAAFDSEDCLSCAAASSAEERSGTDFGSLNSLGTYTSSPRILAIETSCDETAAAVIDGEGRLLANVIASQVDFHARFGGVVPEIASRKHTEAIVGVIDQTLEDAGNGLGLPDLSWDSLDAIAVTYAPGLIGALVVGVAFAKGLSWATGLPLISVNHLEGHIYANRITADVETPFIIALLSGGHTMLVHVRDWGSYEVLGQTLDDAVGEAFDKVAKALGLGYPGGPVISRLAALGNAKAIDFPRAMLHSKDLRFSLSGLKTAVITYIRAEQQAGRKLNLPDVAASFQQAVIDVQVAKALMALEQTGAETFCLGGGVAANKALRDAYADKLQARGIKVIFPPEIACTDNAAMIAAVALDRYRAGRFMDLADDAHAQADLETPY